MHMYMYMHVYNVQIKNHGNKEDGVAFVSVGNVHVAPSSGGRSRDMATNWCVAVHCSVQFLLPSSSTLCLPSSGVNWSGVCCFSTSPYLSTLPWKTLSWRTSMTLWPAVLIGRRELQWPVVSCFA